MTLVELNTCDRATFVNELGAIFEHSPWVAERAFEERPFPSREALLGAMTQEVTAASREEQLALLRAHPDLGTRARMSDASIGEQAGAGLDRLTADEFARLQAMNGSYKQKFGHPFLFAVKGSTKYQVLEALERRLQREPDDEFAEALSQVYRIAQFRLEALLG